MVPLLGLHGANDRQLVPVLCDLGKDLADLNAIGVGRYWLEAGVALYVPGIHLTGSAFEPEENYGLRLSRLWIGCGKGLCAGKPKVITQGDAEEAQGANPKKITPRRISLLAMITFGCFHSRSCLPFETNDCTR